MQDCIFCKIVRGELSSKKEYEDEEALIFQNIEPKAEVHLIAIPKKHISSFLDLDNEMGSLVKAVQSLIRDKGLGSEYKLLINGGKHQQVPHFHLHILSGKMGTDKDLLNQI